jgi:hypothetical protein
MYMLARCRDAFVYTRAFRFDTTEAALSSGLCTFLQ